MAGAPSRLLFLLTNPVSLIHRRPLSLSRLARRHSLTSTSTTTNHHLFLRRTSFTPIKFSQSFYSKATSFALPKNYHNPADGYHSWPEWFRLLKSLSLAGYFNGNSNIEDEFIANENLVMKFVKDANSCLAFARDRPDILGLLPRKDIEVVIDNGYPFLFKSAKETERRVRDFLQAGGFNEATSVDLMKYILSYASNPIIHPEGSIIEATESSVRNLLQEMANISYRGREQMPRNLGPNITMKKGDWICPKCSFMNFARNTQCLECEELRPQRQLTGGEWDCPRCNFFNYRKNVVCLKCECRRPDEASLHGDYGPPGGYNSSTSEISNTYVQSKGILDSDKADRTERWFKKVKELHGVTSLETSISNDEFPQIIPTRKENHFVDNKNKPHQGNSSSFVPFPPNYFAKKDVQQQPESTDLTMKPTSGNFYSNNVNATLGKNVVHETGNQQMSSTNNLDSRSSVGNRPVFSGDTNSSSNQFKRNEPYSEGNRTIFSEDMNTDSSNDRFRRNEPMPERNRTIFSGDTNTNSSSNQFSKNEARSEIGQQTTPESMNVRSGWTGKSLEGSTVTEPDPLDMSEEAKAERWFRRVAQIKDISELSQIPDEDFPSIMPMRKGVNRFVLSKRKTPLERRLTSPQYRKNLRIMSSDTTKNEGNNDN